MLKRTITYTDYNEVERTEDFYFNLSKAELMDMELEMDGGFDKLLEQIINTEDGKLIIGVFKKILLQSYGVKSDDGRRFMKTAEIREAFQQTEAFSQIYTDMFTNVERAVEFVNGIIPKDLAEQVEKTPTHVEIVGTPQIPVVENPSAPEPTKEELLAAWKAQRDQKNAALNA